MFSSLYPLARQALFRLAPEDAHEVTLRALERGLYPRPRDRDSASLAVTWGGLAFPNPLGIAAGFDKDARVPDAVLGMGCGFAEIGTVTPRPQDGNPRPRVFRLVEDHGLVNRLGFNNGGHAAALAHLTRRPRRGIVSVNVGANKDSADRTADYVAGLRAFYDVASMFTVNISSPNTPGLRDLQAPAALDELLGRLMAARRELVDAGNPLRPIAVKIAPDIAEDDIAPIVARLVEYKVEAIAVSNTTVARTNLASAHARETGGLSGRPLFHRATVMLARIYEETRGEVPLIGIGGIDSPERALAKIEAGATLIQLYTGLIYEGPSLIGAIKSRLADAVKSAGVRSIGDLTGRKSGAWAARSLEG
ncbi:MAG: quinone-dependent dihydroorotate dehydrogenase [Hyphomicrobium sp.]|nr:quinone-dependent dihydroorotate dehydrogenase [Hyphomicrobium sp.]